MRPECEAALSAAAGRELTKAELDGIEERITGSLRDMASKDRGKFLSLSPTDRLAEAANMAMDRMRADVIRAHESSIVEAGRKASLQADLDSVQPGIKGQVHALKNKIVGIESKVDALSANFFRQVEGIHEAASGKFFGLFQDPAQSRDIAAALFGEQSSPEAKTAADSLKGMMDSLAERYQRAGLPLNAREDYRTPQPQDPTKVAKGGRDAWVEDHLNWVDPGMYVKPDGRVMSPDELRNMLRESYRSIATDGANKRAEAEGLGGASMLGSTTNAPRQLFFKDSTSWSAAMAKYGRSTNIYELVSNHVRGMAKDISMAEEFGRNADQNVTQSMARAYENDLNAGADPTSLNTMQTKTQRIYDAMMHPDRPGNEYWSNMGIQVRGLIASSQLGSLFGALPDLAGMKLAAEHNGLPAFRMFRDFVDSLTSGAEKEYFLHKLGIWQDGFQHASNRMAADEFKSGWGTWLNEATHRFMGLNAFDRGMRAGMGRVVMDTLGNFTRKFGTLAEAEGEARLLQDRGINQDHWNVWKAAEVDKGRGNESLLTPESIYKIPDATLDPLVKARLAEKSAKPADYFDTPETSGMVAEERSRMKDEAAEKLLELTYGQMQFGARGASRSSVEDRLAMGLETSRTAGTLTGELHRFAAQFKSVPMGIFRNHYAAMQSLDTVGSKAAYGAKFVAYSTLMGALAVELKAIINGQNPRSMNFETDEGRKFWVEALASGGGFGLYGDLFANGQTKYGSGAEVLAGPGISAGFNVIKELSTAREEAMAGEVDSKHQYSLAGLRWVRKNATPFANLWYAKAGFNRLVFDQMQDTLSPGASDKQRSRMEARGASYWWAPGTTAPQGAPDLGKAWE